MNKKEFLRRLSRSLPLSERKERVTFYSEMIDDRMEEGLSEEEAVAAIGLVEPLPEDTKPPRKTMPPWVIVLLVLGSPVWFSLLIALGAVVLSVFIVLWAVMIALWASGAAVAGCAIGGLAAFAILVGVGRGLVGAALLGAGLVCGGVAIWMLIGCRYVTKVAAELTKRAIALLFRKEVA